MLLLAQPNAAFWLFGAGDSKERQEKKRLHVFGSPKYNFCVSVLVRCQTSSLTGKPGFLPANFAPVNTLAEIRASVSAY